MQRVNEPIFKDKDTTTEGTAKLTLAFAKPAFAQ